ncbi:hypothetical protein HK104_001766, partial [Borealophlyctis nickersoniae]
MTEPQHTEAAAPATGQVVKPIIGRIVEPPQFFDVIFHPRHSHDSRRCHSLERTRWSAGSRWSWGSSSRTEIDGERSVEVDWTSLDRWSRAEIVSRPKGISLLDDIAPRQAADMMGHRAFDEILPRQPVGDDT